MADFSVLGEILAETNLDEVAGRIEESMEDAADEMQDAGASAETAEDAMDDLSTSLFSASGASESAEESLQDVENEIEDVRNDAVTASGSITGLAATLRSIDGTTANVNVSQSEIDSSLVDFSQRNVADFFGSVGSPESEGFTKRLTEISDLDDTEAGRVIFELNEAIKEGDRNFSELAQRIERNTSGSASLADVQRTLATTVQATSEDIDTMNKRWHESRNQIDDFRYRVNNIPDTFTDPIGPDVGEKDFEKRAGNITRLTESLEELRKMRRKLSDEDIEFAPFRSVSTIESDEFAEALGRRLEPAGRKETINLGRLKSQLRSIDADTAGDVARAVSQRSDVADNFKEVVDFVNESEEIADTVQRVDTDLGPAERAPFNRSLPDPVGDLSEAFDDDEEDILPENARDLIGGTFGDETGVNVTDAVTNQAMKETFEEVKETTADAASSTDDIAESAQEARPEFESIAGAAESVREMGDAEITENLDAFKEFERAATARMDRASRMSGFGGTEIENAIRQGDLDIRTPLRENIEQKFRQRGIEVDADIIDFKEIESVQDILDQLEEIDDVSGQRNLTALNEALEQTARQVGVLDADELLMDERDTRGSNALTQSLFRLSAASAATNTTFGAMIAFLKKTENNMEELDDDTEDLARSLGTLLPALKTVSANLGPFNIGLTNLAVTIPVLVGSIVPLITVLIGLAGAAIVVAGAFAAILAVGALGFVESLKNNFSDIEETMDAMSAIAKGLFEAVKEAIEPLRSVTIGGLDPQGVFVTFMRDMIELLHIASNMIAELVAMDEVQDFLLEMRAAWLGFSDGIEGITLLESLKMLMRDILPLVEQFSVWLIDTLPDFIAFTTHITRRATPAIERLGKSLLNFTAIITEIGSGAINILFGGIALVIDKFTQLFGVVKEFHDLLGPVGDVLTLVTASMIGLSVASLKAVTGVVSLFRVTQDLGKAMDEMSEAVRESNLAITNYTKSMRLAAIGTSLMLVGILLIAGGLYILSDLFPGLSEAVVNFTEDIIEGAEGMYELIGTVGGVVGLGDELQWLAKFVVGTTMVLVGLGATAQGVSFNLSALSASSFTASVSLDKLSVSATKATASLSGLLKVLSVITLIGIAIGGLSLTAGITELEDFGRAGEFVNGVFEELADTFNKWTQGIHFELTADMLGQILGLITSIVAGATAFAMVLGSINNAGTLAVLAEMGAKLLGVITGISATTALIVGTILIGAAILANWVLHAEETANKFERVFDILDNRVENSTGLTKVAFMLLRGIAWAIIGPWKLLFDIVLDTNAALDGMLKRMKQITAAANNLVPGGGVRKAVVRTAGRIDGTSLGGTIEKLQTGGYIKKEGLAYLHSNEWVIPQEKINRLASNVNKGVDTGRKGFSGSGSNGNAGVTVNINNSGGDIDDRRARQIGRITRDEMRRRRRLEDQR